MLKNMKTRILILPALVAVLGYAVSVHWRPNVGVAGEAEEPGLPVAKAAAQEKAPPPELTTSSAHRDDERMIRQGAEKYCAAYDKGDLDTLISFWAPDGEYIDENGKVTRGREAIRALLAKNRKENPASKLQLRIQSFRFLKPDVVMEEGQAKVTYRDGTTDTGRFIAAQVKNEGTWLLSSVRDLPGETEEAQPTPYDKLKELEWMVGDWTDADRQGVVQASCRWAENKSFLLQQYSVTHGDKVFQISQRIGWDPVNEQIHSWYFDSLGGFGEGVWTREGNKWIIDAAGVLADGRSGSGRDTWRLVNDTSVIWQSRDRQVNNQPLADVEIKFIRKAGEPKK